MRSNACWRLWIATESSKEVNDGEAKESHSPGEICPCDPVGESHFHSWNDFPQKRGFDALNKLNEGESIAQVLSLMVYVNAEDGFTIHSKLADFATDYLCEKLGDAGIAARAALGVASLPGNAPVEIQIICAVS